MGTIMTPIKQKRYLHSLVSPKERLLLWEKIRGLWQNKRQDPIGELKKMRQEWERKLP